MNNNNNNNNNFIWVLKNPFPGVLAQTSDAPDERPGWEQMTVSDFDLWKDQQPKIIKRAKVPRSITPWQMRRALNQLGLRDTVEAAVAAASQDNRDGWEYALEIRRDNALLEGMAQALGLTSAQLDDLFRLAASFQ